MSNENGTPVGPSNLGVAAVGGGGIGTIVVGLAQLLPETNAMHGFLITIAPALSVGISGAWVWAGGQIDEYRTNKRRTKAIADTRNHLQAVIKDPNTTPERLEQAKKQLLILEEKHFQSKIQVIDGGQIA
jgi:hypothetical protein